MKILAISGSPIPDGNNEKIVDYVLKKAKEKGYETEKILFSNINVKPCIACDQCKREKGTCSIKDSMEDIRPKMAEADAIIASSPVYFGSLSAQLKALFDRTLSLRRDDFKLKDKVGAAIAIGRSRNGGQEFTIQATHAWMHIQGMIVVGDNNHFGGAIVHPFEKDEVGKKSIDGTLDKVFTLLEKLK
ncbi:MAG: flavodoxin family protein [Nanoarchaeota archaeon]|nr:flavodoxin family protein [Nanoarchaeota archaeon]